MLWKKIVKKSFTKTKQVVRVSKFFESRRFILKICDLRSSRFQPNLSPAAADVAPPNTFIDSSSGQKILFKTCLLLAIRVQTTTTRTIGRNVTEKRHSDWLNRFVFSNWSSNEGTNEALYWQAADLSHNLSLRREKGSPLSLSLVLPQNLSIAPFLSHLSYFNSKVFSSTTSLSLSLSLILLQQTIHFSLSNMNVFYSLSLFHMNAHLFLSLLTAAGVVAGGAAVLLQNGYLHVLCVKTFCIGIKLFCSTVVLF